MKIPKKIQKQIMSMGHKKPVTRRDFLGYGLHGAVATAALTNFGIPQFALAQNNSLPIPFISFDLVGGVGMPGNFLAAGREGIKNGNIDLLPNYDSLGWDPNISSPDTRFGLPMAGENLGSVLQGMTRVMSDEAQRNLTMCSFCHISDDDSNNNKTSALHYITKSQNFFAQKSNTLVQNAGTRNSVSGGNTQVASVLSDQRPVFIDDFDKFLEGISNKAIRTNQLSNDYFSSTKSIIRKNLDLIVNNPNYDFDSKNHLDIYDQFIALSAGDKLDPRQNDFFGRRRIANERLIPYAITTNVIDGNFGPSTIALPGFDYHQNNQSINDAKDIEAGEYIGLAVEYAHTTRKPFFFQILTDGGVDYTPGTRIARGDAGEKSMTVIGYFDPNKKPEASHFQSGFYREGQGADKDTLIGQSTETVASGVLLNYLAVSGLSQHNGSLIDAGLLNNSEFMNLQMLHV